MSSRRLLAAAVLTVAALGLVGCDPNDPKGGSSAAPAAPSATASGAASGTAKPAPAGKSSSAPDGDPGENCTPAKLPAGHKIVQPVQQPKQNTMPAKATKFACDPNDGHWEAVGSPERFVFAPHAKAELAAGSVGYKSVAVGELWNHIGDCLDGGQNVKPPLTCSAFPVYDITQNSSGEITEIKELWHS
ncbi:hypothetical protein [Kitasatospora sp. NPDC001175]|uniref:hypothetical protein n=1 Tax=Kitasatospora sp. NPDC001175 TaxID=3157103 RepID=UPI003D066E66